VYLEECPKRLEFSGGVL